jgi:hypothetical protein
MTENHESVVLKDGGYHIIDVHWEEDVKDCRWSRILTLQASDGTITTINFHPTADENGVTLIGLVLEKRTCRDGGVGYSILISK